MDCFIKQTAEDYCIDYEVVKSYYDKYYESSAELFYEKLEEHLKKITHQK
jgi:hypothetical protein